MKKTGPWWAQPALIRVLGIAVFALLAKLNKPKKEPK